MDNQKKKVAIIGGGAAGMTAAISAARILKGNKIIIFEKNEQLGRKLLATGNGRCNFSNSKCSWKDYHGQDIGIVREVFEFMGLGDTVIFFEELGIIAREESQGRLYPYSEQASSIRNALEEELRSSEVIILSGSPVVNAVKTDDGFEIILSDGARYKTEKLIVATGGKAGGRLGSTGDGYGIAKKFGHTLIRPLPALVQIFSDDEAFRSIKGVRAKGAVSLYKNGKFLVKETGEIQFTEKGLSGICVFDISRYLDAEMKDYYIDVDLYPEYTGEMLLKKLIKRQIDLKNRTVDVFLNGILHNKLAPVYLRRCGLDPELRVSDVSFGDLKKLSGIMKSWKVNVTGTKGWDGAQVTAGGINTGELNSRTLESKLIPGLYFAGEIIDVDGKCGGWNLQWAWSSGYTAGYFAAESADAQ